VRPGNVYVMPENVQVTMQNLQLVLTPRLETDRLNRCVDEFFFSLADTMKEKAVGIVLSGMGYDGAKGSVAIHEAGGLVLVQEPSSTSFSSMPMSVIREDHPQGVLSPEQLGDYLVQQIAARELQEK
jgi:two-component system CheB/CheR fusion protein